MCKATFLVLNLHLINSFSSQVYIPFLQEGKSQPKKRIEPLTWSIHPHSHLSPYSAQLLNHLHLLLELSGNSVSFPERFFWSSPTLPLNFPPRLTIKKTETLPCTTPAKNNKQTRL